MRLEFDTFHAKHTHVPGGANFQIRYVQDDMVDGVYGGTHGERAARPASNVDQGSAIEGAAGPKSVAFRARLLSRRESEA
jgi:hypothetical protein